MNDHEHNLSCYLKFKWYWFKTRLLKFLISDDMTVIANCAGKGDINIYSKKITLVINVITKEGSLIINGVSVPPDTALRNEEEPL
jgi:hypothetical protein